MKILNIKICLLLLVPITFSNALQAQQKCTDHKSCGLKLVKQNMFTKIPPSQKFLQNRNQKKSQAAFIKVNYLGFDEYPGAITAFEYAADIWEALLPLTVDIEIEAKFEDLGDSTAGVTTSFSTPNSKCPQLPNWINVPLLNTLSEVDVFPDSPDMKISLNSQNSWYFGTDGNTPADQYDFVRVVLHEMGHGFGISGSAKFNDGLNNQACNGEIPDQGCLNDEPEFELNYIYAYDIYVELGNGTAIRNLNSPSIELGNALTSNDLFWNSCKAKAAYNGNRPPLYAPSTWIAASFSHLDENTFVSGNENSLMSPILGAAEAIHSPGPIVMAMLADIGWPFLMNALQLLTTLLVM